MAPTTHSANIPAETLPPVSTTSSHKHGPIVPADSPDYDLPLEVMPRNLTLLMVLTQKSSTTLSSYAISTSETTLPTPMTNLKSPFCPVLSLWSCIRLLWTDTYGFWHWPQLVVQLVCICSSPSYSIQPHWSYSWCQRWSWQPQNVQQSSYHQIQHQPQLSSHSHRLGWWCPLTPLLLRIAERIKDAIGQVGKPSTLTELKTLTHSINARYWEHLCKKSCTEKPNQPNNNKSNKKPEKSNSQQSKPQQSTNTNDKSNKSSGSSTPAKSATSDTVTKDGKLTQQEQQCW